LLLEDLTVGLEAVLMVLECFAEEDGCGFFVDWLGSEVVGRGRGCWVVLGFE
jgi:hypothetical protein